MTRAASYVILAAACGTLAASYGCEDTENELRAQQNEELRAEFKAYQEGEGEVDREIKGEVAERRGELARDVGGDPDKIEDPTSCEAVYRHTAALGRGEDQFAGVEDGKQPPDRAHFMRVCEQLPQDVRGCMSIGYAFRHQEQCEEALDQLDSTLRASFDSVARR